MEAILSKKSIKNESADALYIILGVFCASIGLECFLVPNQLLDGGVTGVSLLLSRLFGWNLSVLIFAINLPFIIMGVKQISLKFGIKTFIAIVLLSVVVEYVHFPVVTQDKLLIAVFGGIFLGSGVGFAMRGAGVLDGTEILALFFSRKFATQVGEFILIINIVIFSIAALAFDLETAMYSILTYIVASRAVDYVSQGIEEYIGVTIISPASKLIRKVIVQKLGRGVSVYRGKRGIIGKSAHEEGLNDQDILFVVITKLELAKLQRETELIDQNAFIVTHKLGSAKGGMLKKRPLH
ncbi:MAG TPA: YitT family protein [Bacteroidales bacterium]|nr:YitT family protein [Bacteroidales bacterium]